MSWTCRVCHNHNERVRARCVACGTPPPRSPHETHPGTASSQSETSRTLPRPRQPRAPAWPVSRARPIVDERAEAFLVSSVLEVPFPLGRDLPVHLGRATTNHVVLPFAQVSRVHATIAWTGRSFVLMDRGSANGTRVNGELVARGELHEGDVIGIGPVDLLVTTDLFQGDESSSGDTVHEGLMAATSLAGELRDVRLAEVWQMLELNQKSGRLRLRSGGATGWIDFAGGQPVHAELGSLSGEPAALELLALAEGSFAFSPGARRPASRTITRPGGSILLEAARRADERGVTRPLPAL